MESSSSFPHQPDEYALDVLVHATRMAHPQPGFERSTARHVPGASTAMITNRRKEHHQDGDRAAAPSTAADVITGYGPAVLSSRSSMDALMFNPGVQQVRQSSYMVNGFQVAAPLAPPSYATDHLGILNAESYDDGRGRSDGAGMRQQQQQQQQRVMPFGITDAPKIRMEPQQRVESEEQDGGGRRRKKPRIEVQSGEDDDDAKKKARGRPRVDTKDETAADRRRTQIRMAQRAYRHRKETTISSLEKQVQELKGTNEEMANIFTTLYDFAVGRGLVQREPEFGRQLQATTERFLALAKASSNEDLSHDELQLEEPRIEPSVTARATGRTTSSRAPSAQEIQQQTPPVSEPTQPWGGYTVVKEDSPTQEIPQTFQQQAYENNSNHRDLQVITRPTEENASFPFDFTDLQSYRVEVPSIEDFSLNFYPHSQLPLPATHNYTELSFARRLQRAALERAFRLVSSPNPPSERFRAIFGFCMLYESKDAILARIKRLMAKSAKESLQEWQAPFVHIGGAGTFYPIHDNNINGDLMPKFRTGYSMGPFSQSVSEVQEIIDDDMRLNLPGFGGEFFDPNDVEGYLRGRGLDIRPAADYVTGVVDFVDLPDGNSPNSSDSGVSVPSPETPKSPVNKMLKTSNVANTDLDFDPFDMNMTNDSYFNISDNAQFSQPYNWNDETATKDFNAFLNPIVNTIPIQQPKRPYSSMTGSMNGAKRTVTVNVNVLIDEILRKVVCLARSPGFRVSDINAALVAAVKAGP